MTQPSALQDRWKALAPREQNLVLAAGTLVALLPDAPLDVPLYWAHSCSAQQSLSRLTQCVMAAARACLDTLPCAT